MTSIAEAVTATKIKATVMKCHDCNAPFTSEFGNCASGNECLAKDISHSDKDDQKKDWWWCRDCMATVCRLRIIAVKIVKEMSDGSKNNPS
ncbi:Uncharacterized protein BM_BM9675 [Brugia malayi]|uniref:Bm9675 n=1 Tax=Brugia malayi TaxID=6279 RepID=A0A0J9XTD9_BRUMA|nr:Uncharacterized protein BM_BM9675 [Brugia malayi]CDP95085.1 Bm9675 [Brugia malayi]VIO95336.1 Uncharacterized protein BM_BM9675 [Brugia malayi]